MRIIDRGQCRVNQIQNGPRRRMHECRAILRVALFRFLFPGLHRPTGCAHWHRQVYPATRPHGWAGVRP